MARKDGGVKYRADNREQLAQAQSRRYYANPDLHKAKRREYLRRPEVIAKRKQDMKVYSMRHSYGFTKEQYEKMYQQQEGCCGCCHRPIVSTFDSIEKSKTHIDHEHKTGKVRGLLCLRCNHAVGWVEKHSGLLHLAGVYLATT